MKKKKNACQKFHLVERAIFTRCRPWGIEFLSGAALDRSDELFVVLTFVDTATSVFPFCFAFFLVFFLGFSLFFFTSFSAEKGEGGVGKRARVAVVSEPIVSLYEVCERPDNAVTAAKLCETDSLTAEKKEISIRGDYAY